MIIPEVNVLIRAHNLDSPIHRQARGWWEETLGRPRQVGLPWVSILGFIRIVTQRRLMHNPMLPSKAIRMVRSWLDEPRVEIIAPGEGHAEILFRLLEELGVAANLTTDAHLAALAIEYQAELATTDPDFTRFKGLRWFNPLMR